MSPDEIKAKAASLAELYTAKANGKTLQFLTDVWADYEHDAGPSMGSDLSRWRVKPEPRKMWTTIDATTFNESQAAIWKKAGAYTVTEWQEVLP